MLSFWRRPDRTFVTRVRNSGTTRIVIAKHFDDLSLHDAPHTASTYGHLNLSNSLSADIAATWLRRLFVEKFQDQTIPQFRLFPEGRMSGLR